MSKNKAIIVKKVKKVTGGGHHGGAWKVAYADFVTAMMAFFLLMWLLNMTSDEKRARLSMYFKYFSIYDSGGTSWMEKSSEIFGESGENSQKVFEDKKNQTINNSLSAVSLNSIEESLRKEIADKLADVKDQVLVDVTDEGVRIQMIDKEGSLMFERGNTKLTPKAKEVLKFISEEVKIFPNKIIIEGHTDSLPYAGSQYSNWELSTERASSARKELEVNGVAPDKIDRVTGYADTDPFIKENKEDPRNRRISITLNMIKRNVANSPIINIEEKQIRKTAEELGYSIERKAPPVIKKSQANLQSSDSSTTGKYMSEPDKRTTKQTVIKSEYKGQAVIKELSEPVIKFK